MLRLSNRTHRAGVAALLGLGVAFTAGAQPAADRTPPGLDARLDRLTEGLDLSAAQTSSLEALASRYADADRAGLWEATADLADILTDAQIDQLQAAVEARRGDRAERRADGPRGGERRARGRRGDRGAGERGARPDRADLTDEQRTALREIRSDVREQTEALVAQLRDGQISDEAFEAQVREARDDGMRRSAEILPDAAAERMAERQAAREADQAARERVLGLTADQQDRLRALRLDRVREHEPLDVRPYLNDDGSIDREAMREAMRARREASRGERAERRDATADVLSEDQKDLVFLHAALAGGRGMRGEGRGGRGRRGGPGGMRGGF